MKTNLDFSKMKFFDFNSVERVDLALNIVTMSDDCYMCQDCYNR